MKKTVVCSFVFIIAAFVFSCSDNSPLDKEELHQTGKIQFKAESKVSNTKKLQTINTAAKVVPDDDKFLINWAIDDAVGIFVEATDGSSTIQVGDNKKYNATPR